MHPSRCPSLPREKEPECTIEPGTMQHGGSLHVARGFWSIPRNGTAVSSRCTDLARARAREHVLSFSLSLPSCHCLYTSERRCLCAKLARAAGRTKCIINYYGRPDSVIGRRLIAAAYWQCGYYYWSRRSFGWDETPPWRSALILRPLNEQLSPPMITRWRFSVCSATVSLPRCFLDSDMKFHRNEEAQDRIEIIAIHKSILSWILLL